MPISLRRKARTIALQVLYEMDCSGHPAEATLKRASSDAALPQEGLNLATELVLGVDAHRAALDEIIHRHAPDFPVEQISVVDRNILRIAIYEIVLQNKAPPKVAINEAVELSKLFGSLNIHRFINGVLGSVLEAEGAKTGILPGGNSGDRL